MNRNFILLFIVINALVIGFGGFITYSDLYLREENSYSIINSTVINVEYLPFGYRPTYEYYIRSTDAPEQIVSEGSYTLDFFQFSILIVVISDLFWINFERKKIR